MGYIRWLCVHGINYFPVKYFREHVPTEKVCL